MGACRESLKISHYWNTGRYDSNTPYFKRIKINIGNVLMLFRRVITNKWDRKMFMKDNFYTPYFQSIGCKITPHKFFYDSEDHEYFCTRCYFKISEEKYAIYIRKQKLKNIL